MRATITFAAAGFALLLAAPAHAQSTRTWVSGVGDDFNPCSRTAPCKTFSSAMSKTAAGGEINCLDPAGFGAITINKSLTIDCTGTLGGILSAGTANAVVVNAAATDKVVLRGIQIDGAGTGTNGVRLLAGREVTLENVSIVGLTGTGVELAPSVAGAISILNIKNVTITRANKGLRLAPTNGAFAVGSIVDAHIWGVTAIGVELLGNNAVASVDTSVVSEMFPTSGVAFQVSGGNGVLMVDNSSVTNNSTAFNMLSGTTRVSGNKIYENSVAFNVAGGTFASGGDNKVAPNSAVNPTVVVQSK
jgi:hypothetical protein